MSKSGDVYRKGPIELRCGDYREVLQDIEPDAVITDPPYSQRTHNRHCAGLGMNNMNNTGRPTVRREIGYAGWGAHEVAAFLARWTICAGWIVVLTDDVLAPVWDQGYESSGRVRFAPLPIVATGMTVRLAGDGPSNWTVWAMVSRPRSAAMRKWGTLRGAYVVTHGGSRARGVVGAKPLSAMRALVRDYSRPGDLVCDPCAGGATTLIAAALEGRRAIGAELDPETFDKACARIERTALTVPLDFGPRKVQPVQIAWHDPASETG